MSTANLANEKKQLRQQLRALRAAIPSEEKQELDRRIVQHIAASAAFQRASTLLLYAPREDEINLLPLVRIARKRGMRVAFPRCDTATEQMQFFLLEENARLVPGAYGIFEPPADAPPCPYDRQTLCLLPGLAIDTAGNRLGYGKGYYDRFLSDFSGTTLCAVYRRLLVASLPTEAHDRPVGYLCTEEGMGRIERHSNPSGQKQSAPSANARSASLRLALRHGCSRFKLWLLAKDDEGHWRYPTSPLLILAVYLLLLLLRPIDTHLLRRGSEHLVVILLQLLILVLPAIIYLKLRSAAFGQRLRMHPPRLSHSWLMVCALILMITGGLLSQILTGGIRQLNGSFTLYDTFVARNNGSLGTTFYLILAYCLLPAFSEELIFRSLLTADYEKHGAAVSILLSGLFFACLHFDLQHFLTYLLLGMLLCSMLLITESFFAVLLLHFLYNLFCLFGQPYLSNFYVTAGSNEIFLFCLITVFLLFAALAAGEVRKILHVYARQGKDSPFPAPPPLRRLPSALGHALLAPAPVACLLVWLAVSLLRML